MPVLAHEVYTDDPGKGPFVIFPTHAHQILSNCIHIVGASILSYCLARRTENERFTTWQWWTGLTWARLLVILLFLDSWFFLASSGILVNGVGLSFSEPVCSLGILSCIIFYACSKALIYLFLVERVWIVCSAGNTLTRCQSRIYRGCMGVIFGFLAIFVLLFIYRYSHLRKDGVCMIGIDKFASIPLLIYDLLMNVFLTSMFIWSLYREQNISVRLRCLARRTAFASTVALVTSGVNIFLLLMLKGRQLGWVCLGSCATDVTVNALVVFWVTAGTSRDACWHGNWDHVHWQWENKGDGGGPMTLPPLEFPVSFVADTELGLRADDPINRDVDTVGGFGVAAKVQGERDVDADDSDSDAQSIEEWDIADSSSYGGHRRSGSSCSTTALKGDAADARNLLGFRSSTLITLDLGLDTDLDLKQRACSSSIASQETRASCRLLARGASPPSRPTRPRSPSASPSARDSSPEAAAPRPRRPTPPRVHSSSSPPASPVRAPSFSRSAFAPASSVPAPGAVYVVMQILGHDLGRTLNELPSF
ncbi:hypothetical protein DFH11DRAFT_1070892 [Phellopilus nigrolimitatus]|nr:hypothetical protein DFH11DRAFT_1070892 [Phellopilus nigrolimitatus]